MPAPAGWMHGYGYEITVDHGDGRMTRVHLVAVGDGVEPLPEAAGDLQLVEGPLEARARWRAHAGIEQGEPLLDRPHQLGWETSVGLRVAVERGAERAAGHLDVLRVPVGGRFGQVAVHVVL